MPYNNPAIRLLRRRILARDRYHAEIESGLRLKAMGQRSQRAVAGIFDESIFFTDIGAVLCIPRPYWNGLRAFLMRTR